MKCHVGLGPTSIILLENNALIFYSTVHRIEGCCPPRSELDLSNSYMTRTEGQHETENRAAKPCRSILFKMLTSYDGI
jgi:hypothetical protein